MAVHIIATDRVIDRRFVSRADESPLREGIFDEDCGSYRGFLFAMLFNIFLVVSGIALWLLLRK